MNLNRVSQSPPTGFAWLVSLALACLVWLLSSTAAIAAPPPANSVIGNQATATYTDGTGTTRNVTSNLVQTTVAQVFSHTLTASQTKVAPQGSTVYFPHVLTNTGNGPDTYTLSNFNLTTDDFNLGNIRMFADANGDGLPDNATAITSTGALAAGADFRFVVAGEVPAPQTTGSQALVRVGAVGHASDANNYAASATAPVGAEAGVLDTTTISNQAVINVNKSFNVITGPTGTTVVVTLNYTNIGGAAATDVTLTDAIGVAATPTAGFSYVAGSGRWTTGAAVPVTLTDAAGETVSGITYTVGVPADTITAVIASVAPGDSGQVSFQVTVAASALVGTSTTTNTADVSYNDGSAVITTKTNSVAFTVVATRGVNVQDITGAAPFNANGTDSTVRDDNVVIASAPQGSSIDYRVYVTNTGNAADTFNMTMVPGTFPAGTTFQFFSSTDPTSATSGAGAPLVDSNGDGIPDTGPVAIGATIPVFVRVQLPAAAVSNTALTADVRATSVGNANTGLDGINAGDPAATRDASLTLSDIVEKAVDLTNVLTRCTTQGSDNGSGVQPTGEVSFRCSNSVESGQKAVFELVVTNSTGSADSYDLLGADSNTSINTANFAASLPVGWTLEFRRASAAGGVGAGAAVTDAANCAVPATLSGMPVIINTGNISAGQAMAVCAVVSIPANQTATTQSLFFRAASPASVSYSTPTAAFDVKHDQVVVTNANLSALTIAPNRTGQVYPGGNVVYSHEVCNVGNATLASVDLLSTMTTQTPSGWTNTMYLDGGTPGVLDPADIALGTNSIGAITNLARNTCVTVLNNVFAPLGAPQGAYAVQTLTATYAGGPGAGVSVTDTTQVIVGDVTLEKTQGLGTGAGTCTGLPGSYSVATLTNTNPGAFVCYNILAKNTGSGPVTALNIQDVAPQYSTLVTAAGVCAPTLTSAGGVIPGDVPASPTVSGSSIVSGAVTTVPPGGTVTMRFCVRIDN